MLFKEFFRLNELKDIDAEITRILSGIGDPASLTDDHLAAQNFPFLYMPPHGRLGELLVVGNEGDLHHELINDYKSTPYYHDLRQMVNQEYRSAHAVGRIGLDLRSYNAYLYDVGLMAFYPSSDTRSINMCAHKLIKDNYIPKQYTPWVSFAGRVYKPEETKNITPATQKQIEDGKLQIAMHIGAWPDGRRLTSQEKDSIRKQLGLKPPAMKRSGMPPGVKWWAPTSENSF